MKTDENKIRPFYCGTQFADWEASNCGRCTKSNFNLDDHCGCLIQNLLIIAYFNDGLIDKSIAKKMGLNEKTKKSYVWPCLEVEWTEEWKKECLKKES